MQLYLAGRPIRNIRQFLRLGGAILRDDLALQRGARRMPIPVPWEWARPRLMPLLAGPRIDTDADSPVRARAESGCTVTFGIDLGGAFAIVDRPVARRWECTVDQIGDVAFANLRRRAARLDPGLVRGGTLGGHRIRILQGKPPWSTSLLLVPGELGRLFGEDDQLFLAPERSTLISLPIDVPGRLAANILVDFEDGAAWPLMLDPFVLEDGALEWGGVIDDEAKGDEPP